MTNQAKPLMTDAEIDKLEGEFDNGLCLGELTRIAQLCAQAKLANALTERVARLEGAIRVGLNELGDPGDLNYPANVAEAHRGLLYALCQEQCPPCDMGENTDCICPPKALAPSTSSQGEA